MYFSLNITSADESKVADVNYEIIDYFNLSETLRQCYDLSTCKNTRLIYEDEGYQYLIICYGPMSTTGYSIEVNALYETKNTIIIDTTLKGPSKQDYVEEKESSPTMVIRIPKQEKLIIFK